MRHPSTAIDSDTGRACLSIGVEAEVVIAMTPTYKAVLVPSQRFAAVDRIRSVASESTTHEENPSTPARSFAQFQRRGTSLSRRDYPPVPVSTTVWGLPGAVSTIVINPALVPVAVGVNVTVTVQVPAP